MRDPFPISPPVWLIRIVKPSADYLNLQTLPLHAHEVLIAAIFYTVVCNYVSPIISARLCPKTYRRFGRRTKINWDVHVVSMTQSLIINALSLWVIWCDEERKEWRRKEEWQMRIWGYNGAGGLCQSFALGYFLWDFVMCARHLDIFGVGMLAHSISAVSVFAFGYRPFLYFYAPVFLLYELSSPFLNVHWFCDKLDLTGSIYQAVNGAFLTLTFFGCRLVWGLSSSFFVFRDIYWVIRAGHSRSLPTPLSTLSTEELLAAHGDSKLQLVAFKAEKYLPLWLALIYLASNLVLNTLNIFWFGKMIQTIRARFDPPLGTRGTAAAEVAYDPVAGDVDGDAGSGEQDKDETEGSKQRGSVRAARERAEQALGEPVEEILMQRAAYDDGQKGLEVTGSIRRSARSRRKA